MKDWFEKIEDCCRTAGWVWANVAGYSFFYAGNSLYWSLLGGQNYDPSMDWTHQPCGEELRQILNKDVTCNTNLTGAHIAERSYISKDMQGIAFGHDRLIISFEFDHSSVAFEITSYTLQEVQFFHRGLELRELVVKLLHQSNSLAHRRSLSLFPVS